MLGLVLEEAQDNASVCAHIPVRLSNFVHTSILECVISVLSHRHEPKPSYEP